MGLEAGLSIEASFELFGKRLDEMNKRMRQYLEGRQVIPRDLPASGPVTAPPFALDLGAPAGGLIWEAGQVVVFATTPGTVAANINGYVGRGKLPTAGQDGAPSDIVGTFASLPAMVSLRKVVCNSGNDHLYVVFVGAGVVAGLQVFATATVYEAVDQPQTLSWL